MNRSMSIQASLLSAVVVVNLLALVATYYWLDKSKQQHVQRAEVRARNLAYQIDRSIASSMGKVRFTVQGLSDELQRLERRGVSLDATELRAAVSTALAHLPEVDGLEVTDANGHKLFGRGPRQDWVTGSAGDGRFQSQFEALQQGSEGDLAFTKPLWSDLANRYTIVMVHSRKNAAGEFAGVVAATIAVSYFQRILENFDADAVSGIALRDLGLGLLAEVLSQPGQLAKALGSKDVLPAFQQAFESGTIASVFHAQSGTDGAESIVSYLRMREAPFLISVQIDQQQYLSAWAQERYKAVWSLLCFAIFTLVLGVLLARQMHRYTQESERNAIYLHNASDGIQISTGSGRLVEVNEQLCQMLCHTRGALLAMPHNEWLQCWPDARARLALTSEDATPHAAQQLETQLLRGDGSLLDVEVRLSRFNWSGRDHVHASVRDITERKAHAEQIQNLAFYDVLTHLPNRRLMQERLDRALVTCERTKRFAALMLLDMDNFKALNDTLGHAVGDQLLTTVAARLQKCIRQGDTASRMGGDEFVVLLEGLGEDDVAACQAEAIAEKISIALQEPYLLTTPADAHGARPYTYECTASIGLTLFNDKSLGSDDLLKRADTAMYQAKAAGRNAVRFYDPQMQARVDERNAMEMELRQAIDKGQLLLHYQAQVDSSDQVHGAEVLVRWQRPQGMVMPAEFIGLAEETGLILPIGTWVLQTACAQLKAWEDKPSYQNLVLAVNVSARQFKHAQFVEQVKGILQYTGANPHLLKLELTESLMVHNVTETAQKMYALSQLGISLSLDDFGTGYSSLSYLQRLHLHQLKIDKSFVHNMIGDSKNAAIVQTVVDLAHNLALHVIAEGVETEVQRDYLHAMGCHAYQGYLYGRPCPVGEFEQLVQQRQQQQDQPAMPYAVAA